MSDFIFDLSDEKLSAIEAAISQLEGDISETQQKVKRLEVLEFFDRGDSSRQTVVHWLEEVDPETIVSIGKAKDAFIEYSESRAETDMKVGHGDVLVIGGDCPYYALCAKVDVGVVGGDAGFQSEDPMDVAGTELENEKAFKEFIVWGGCGNEGGAPGGGDDGCVGTPSSISISTALATTGGGVGPSIKLTEITPDPYAPDPPEEFTFNSGLSDFTIVEDPDAVVESGASFLAFDDSDITICPEGCGIKVALKKTELEKKLHKINAQPLEQKKVTIYPQELTTKNYTSQTGTITVSTASISSDKCGNLSSDGGGGGGGGATFGLSTLVEGVVEAPKPADLLDIQDVPLEDVPQVSIGNLTIPTDFSQTALAGFSEIENKKAFIPMLNPDTCPESATITTVTNLSLSVTKGACDGDGCQEITLSIQPLTTDLIFKCGLLISHGDETAGDNPPLVETLKVPCGCNTADPECDPSMTVESVTVTFTSDPRNVTPQFIGISETVIATKDGCRYIGDGVSIDFDADTELWNPSGNGGSGNWSIAGTPAHFPNQIGTRTVFAGSPVDFIIISYS